MMILLLYCVCKIQIPFTLLASAVNFLSCAAVWCGDGGRGSLFVGGGLGSPRASLGTSLLGGWLLLLLLLLLRRRLGRAHWPSTTPASPSPSPSTTGTGRNQRHDKRHHHARTGTGRHQDVEGHPVRRHGNGQRLARHGVRREHHLDRRHARREWCRRRRLLLRRRWLHHVHLRSTAHHVRGHHWHLHLHRHWHHRR